MKRTPFFVFSIVFPAIFASAIEFGDIEARYPLYSVSDPFAIGVATNAYNKAMAETALRTAAIISATNAVTAAYLLAISDEATQRINGDSASAGAVAAANAHIANNSNRLNTAFVYIANESNRVNTANVNIAANSNGLVTANVNIANTSNSVVALDAKLVATSNVLASAIGNAGISAETSTNIAQAVIEPYTNRVVTAWQNPPSATNWTWTSDGHEITLTGYNFVSMDVVIPDTLDGLPVTGILPNIFSFGEFGSDILSVSGGNNVTNIPGSCFYGCYFLSNVNLPSVVSLEHSSFGSCVNLVSVNTEKVKNIGINAFAFCTSLVELKLPSVESVGNYAFQSCTALLSVIFSTTAPQIGDTIFINIPANQVTNYVTNPTSTGWGATFGGMPVVRMPIYADSAIIAGTNILDSLNQRVEKSNGTATNLSVFSSLNLFDHIITWNSDRQTFDIPLFGGVTGQLFQEQLLLVRNQTGANIANGKIVCSAGAVGDNSAIRKASSSDISCAWGILGMVTQDAGIDHGEDGLICTGGEVNNLPLPTSIYQPSNTLWLTTDGNYTNVEPQNVAVKYQIGIVLRAHATEGRIQFHPQFIPSPETLGALPTSHNTDITAHQDLRELISGATVISRKISISSETVVVHETNAIYRVSVSSPNSISNDLSHIVFDGNAEKKWELWVNYLTTNALSSVWDNRMDFGGLTPDLTVTGQYKFACSTVDGITIQAKQIYPTVYEWHDTMYGNTSVMSHNWAFNVLTTTTNSTTTQCYRLWPSSYTLTQITGYATAASNEFSVIHSVLRYGFSGIVNYTNRVVPLNLSYAPYVVSFASAPVFSGNFTYVSFFEFYRDAARQGVSIAQIKTRKLNELEIKAYNAGWRP